MGNSKDQYLKNSLIIIIIILGGILFYNSLPFLSGVLGACTVYFLVRKQMRRLVNNKHLKKSVAAILILLEALLCFLIPAFLIVWLLVNKITTIDLNTHSLINSFHGFITFINDKTGYDLLNSDNISRVATTVTDIAQLVVSQVSSFVINSLVLLFVLYFMLVASEPMEKYVYSILPFKDKYKKKVLDETNKMVKANAIGIPLLAIIQGFFAFIGYWIFGVPDPLLFGFITCFATIIPLIGTAIVWFPLVLFLGFSGNWGAAIGLAAYALLVIANIDNLVRFVLQERLASTHPLITVFGVVIGLAIFGFWGVIFGPLMISLFVLCLDIFKKEYIDNLK